MQLLKSILPIGISLGLASCAFAPGAAMGGSPHGAPAPQSAPPRVATSLAPWVLQPSILKSAPVVVRREEAALAILERQVWQKSHPDALRLAVEAYWRYRSAYPAEVRKPYLYYVDFGLDSRTPRGYVFDMDALEIVDGPFTVAHGRGSARGLHGVPTRFTNIKDSNATSLGLYLAEETYAFRGTAAGRRYRSIGLRLKGVSGPFNDAARERGIVVHGAPYVTPEQAGRSEGCPAMEPERAERLIPMIAEGGMVFHFSPYDTRWLQEDPWVGMHSPRLAGGGMDPGDGPVMGG